MEKIFYTKRLQAYIQAEEPGFMGGPDFLRGVATLTKYGFKYDLLPRSSQVKEASKFVGLNPT
ncbi:MAG: hypothetical protein V4708_06850 [Bacteroidota bacterium]